MVYSGSTVLVAKSVIVLCIRLRLLIGKRSLCARPLVNKAPSSLNSSVVLLLGCMNMRRLVTVVALSWCGLIIIIPLLCVRTVPRCPLMLGMATTSLPDVSGPLLRTSTKLARLTLGTGSSKLRLHTRRSARRRGSRLIEAVEKWPWAPSKLRKQPSRATNLQPRMSGPFRQIVIVPRLRCRRTVVSCLVIRPKVLL